jgi:hypothetical protein
MSPIHSWLQANNQYENQATDREFVAPLSSLWGSTMISTRTSTLVNEISENYNGIKISPYSDASEGLRIPDRNFRPWSRFLRVSIPWYVCCQFRIYPRWGLWFPSPNHVHFIVRMYLFVWDCFPHVDEIYLLSNISSSSLPMGSRGTGSIPQFHSYSNPKTSKMDPS